MRAVTGVIGLILGMLAFAVPTGAIAAPSSMVVGSAETVHDGRIEQLRLDARVTDPFTCAATGLAVYDNSALGSYRGTVVWTSISGGAAFVVVRKDVADGSFFGDPGLPYTYIYLYDSGQPGGAGDTMQAETLANSYYNYCLEPPVPFLEISSGNIIVNSQ